MYELKPMNKYVWLEPITAENKVGSLFVVSHSQNSYQLGKIRAVAECDETKGLVPGTTVLYDALGSVNHRVGSQTITTIKAVNILGVVVEVFHINVGDTSPDQVDVFIDQVKAQMLGKVS